MIAQQPRHLSGTTWVEGEHMIWDVSIVQLTEKSYRKVGSAKEMPFLFQFIAFLTEIIALDKEIIHKIEQMLK